MQDKEDKMKYCCLIKVGRQLSFLISLHDTNSTHVQRYTPCDWQTIETTASREKQSQHDSSIGYAVEGAGPPANTPVLHCSFHMGPDSF